MNQASGPYKGSCLCGAIRYEVDQIGSKMAHCHCSMCRKFHGAAFATFGDACEENFRWLSGEDLLVSYRAENGTVRQFCQQCGTSLTFKAATGQEGMIEFSLGTLDSEIPHRPDAHIYVDYKADWFDITDDLVCYRETRGSETTD